MDEFETLVIQAITVPSQDKFRSIEEKQLTLRQEILQVNNSGRNFLEDARKVNIVFLNFIILQMSCLKHVRKHFRKLHPSGFLMIKFNNS